MTGKVPFSEVYCHGLIRDKDGKKMSKSDGNVIDPLDVISGITLEKLHEKTLAGNLEPEKVARAKKYQKEAFPQGLPECGTDSLRFTLVNLCTGAPDINFSIGELESWRKFCNKIFQATNFVLKRLGDDFTPAASPMESKPLSLAEKWILHEFNNCGKAVDKAIEGRDFYTVTHELHQYLRDSLCDVFIENSKYLITGSSGKEEEAAKQTLYTALEGGLLLLHPVMPYITEYLWQKLPRRAGDKTKSIMVASFPEFKSAFEFSEAAANYQLVMDVAKGLRSLPSQYAFKEPGDLFIQTYNEKTLKTVNDELNSIKSLGGKYVGTVEVLPPSNQGAPKGCVVYAVSADAAVYLRIAGKLDLTKEKEKAETQLKNAKEAVSKVEDIMAAPGWAKAKAEVKAGQEKKKKDAESEVKNFEEVISGLERLILETQQA